MRLCKKVLTAFGLVPLCSAVLAADVTGTFTGIAANSYDNQLGGNPPANFNGAMVGGTFDFESTQMVNSGLGFYDGPGVLITIFAEGQVFSSGGIGYNPGTNPVGIFTPVVGASGQTVTLESGNFTFDFASSLTLKGAPNSFGPDGNLSATTFAPGAAQLSGSFAQFGDRSIGATIYLTSLTMTQGPVSVTVNAVPEVPSAVAMLVGLVLLGCSLKGRTRAGAINKRAF